MTDKPAIILRKQGNKLAPVSAFDDEELSAFPQDQEFRLTPIARRSAPLQRTYWKMLAEAVKDEKLGDTFPTHEHLHEALKYELGYVRVIYDTRGKPHVSPDSTSFKAMKTDAEFRPYFDAAVKRLAEVTGADPLGFMEVA